MDAAIAALLGTAVGAIGSVGGVWLSQKAQTRRDLLKTATELALADFNFFVGLAKQKGGSMHPISIYVAYHAEVLNAIADGTFNAAAVTRIEQRMKELGDALPKRD